MEKMKKTREKENSACVYDNCYMTIVISHFLKSINVAFYNQKVEKKPCDWCESWLKRKIKQKEKLIYQPAAMPYIVKCKKNPDFFALYYIFNTHIDIFLLYITRIHALLIRFSFCTKNYQACVHLSEFEFNEI